jgi:hypothetical protein
MSFVLSFLIRDRNVMRLDNLSRAGRGSQGTESSDRRDICFRTAGRLAIDLDRRAPEKIAAANGREVERA